MKVAHNRKTFAVRLSDLAAGSCFRMTPGGHVLMVCDDGQLASNYGKSWRRLVDLETGSMLEESCAAYIDVEPVHATLVEGHEEPER